MLEDCKRHAGVLLVRMRIPAAQSLKDKRMAIRSMRDRIRSKFNVSIAELEGQEKWQSATFGFSMISSDPGYLEGNLHSILSLIESCHAWRSASTGWIFSDRKRRYFKKIFEKRFRKF